MRGGESSGTGRVSPWLRRFELNHALADERGGGVRRAGQADGARAGSSECARACGRERDCGPETGARASGDGRGGGVTAGGEAYAETKVCAGRGLSGVLMAHAHMACADGRGVMRHVVWLQTRCTMLRPQRAVVGVAT